MRVRNHKSEDVQSHWSVSHKTIMRWFLVCMLAASMFIAGWQVSRNQNDSYADSKPMSAAMAKTQSSDAAHYLAVYHSLHDSYKKFANKTQLVEYTRGICLASIMHRYACLTTPVRIVPTKGIDARAVYNLSNDHGNTAVSITIDPAALKSDPASSSFMLAHEWNHIESALTVGTKTGYDNFEARAAHYYYRLDGKPITKTLAMEAQTDCMALENSHQRIIGYQPYYLSQVGSIGSKSQSVQNTCKYWRDVLYGDPSVNYGNL